MGNVITLGEREEARVNIVPSPVAMVMSAPCVEHEEAGTERIAQAAGCLEYLEIECRGLLVSEFRIDCRGDDDIGIGALRLHEKERARASFDQLKIGPREGQAGGTVLDRCAGNEQVRAVSQGLTHDAFMHRVVPADTGADGDAAPAHPRGGDPELLPPLLDDLVDVLLSAAGPKAARTGGLRIINAVKDLELRAEACGELADLAHLDGGDLPERGNGKHDEGGAHSDILIPATGAGGCPGRGRGRWQPTSTIIARRAVSTWKGIRVGLI